MPYTSDSIQAEEFLHHNMVRVYHTYKNDDMDQGSKQYQFTLDPYGSESSDETRFDVRSLDVPAAAKFNDHPPYITLATPSDDPVRQEWEKWRTETEPAIINEVIIQAIDAGILVAGADGEQVEADASVTFSAVEIALQNAEVRWGREQLLDVIQEVHDDILAVHGVDEDGGRVLDEESLDWPDLAISHKKMAQVLKDCQAGVDGDAPGAAPVATTSASDATHPPAADRLHEMLDAILTGLDRKACPPAFMADVDQLGKAFIAKLQPIEG